MRQSGTFRTEATDQPGQAGLFRQTAIVTKARMSAKNTGIRQFGEQERLAEAPHAAQAGMGQNYEDDDYTRQPLRSLTR
jgi:hypothetical protein